MPRQIVPGAYGLPVESIGQGCATAVTAFWYSGRSTNPDDPPPVKGQAYSTVRRVGEFPADA